MDNLQTSTILRARQDLPLPPGGECPTESVPSHIVSVAMDSPEARAIFEYDTVTEESSRKEALFAILDEHMLPHRQQDMVIDEVCHDIAQRAELFREDISDSKFHPRIYLRMNDTGAIVDLFEANHLEDLVTEYGLTIGSSLHKTVAGHICQRVRLTGKLVKVCAGYHYAADTKTLYVSVDPLRTLRMTSTRVEYADNVVDGLLFLPNGEPIDVDIDAISASKLGMKVAPGSQMFDQFNATYGDGVTPAAHYHQLVCTRILALFFPDLFTARSMLILVGEPGCGKTIIAQKIGWLMRGSRFEVSLLSARHEDMETLLTSDPLVVLDNLDEPKAIRPYVPLLCQAVTGGAVNKRQLYSNHTHLSYPFVASLICTTIDPSWVRDTISDRALIIPLSPRIKDGSNQPDIQFKREALTLRPALMTEVLGRCRNILVALGEQSGYRVPNVIRLHDFSGFLMRCAVHEGWATEGLDILRTVAGSQREEADANNPIHDVVRYYIGYDPTSCGKHLAATALGKAFREAAEKMRLDLRFEWGGYDMRGLLQKQFSTLEKKFGLHCGPDSHRKSNQYWFEPTPDVVEQCKDFVKQIDPFHSHFSDWGETLCYKEHTL